MLLQLFYSYSLLIHHNSKSICIYFSETRRLIFSGV